MQIAAGPDVPGGTRSTRCMSVALTSSTCTALLRLTRLSCIVAATRSTAAQQQNQPQRTTTLFCMTRQAPGTGVAALQVMPCCRSQPSSAQGCKSRRICTMLQLLCVHTTPANEVLQIRCSLCSLRRLLAGRPSMLQLCQLVQSTGAALPGTTLLLPAWSPSLRCAAATTW